MDSARLEIGMVSEDIQVRMVLLGEIVVEYGSLTCDWTHFIQKSQTDRSVSMTPSLLH